MSLSIIIGPMQSGKSSELRKRISRYITWTKVLVLNSSNDTRTKTDSLSTHDKTININLKAFKVNNLVEVKDWEIYKDAKIIGIDEAQFFGEDLIKFVALSILDQKHVIVAGLDSDMNLNTFGHINKLIPLASEIVKLESYCGICKDGTPAHFTHCINRHSDDIIQVGDGVDYVPVCFKHYCMLNKNPLQQYI